MGYGEDVEPGRPEHRLGLAAATGGIPNAVVAQQVRAVNELREVVGDDEPVLHRAVLTVAGVDDEGRTGRHRRADLDGGAEPGAAPAGQTGVLEEVDERAGHDHSWRATARRRSVCGSVASTRQPIAPTPTTAQAIVTPRRTSWSLVLNAMPWMTASGQRTKARTCTPRQTRSGSRCRSREVSSTAAAMSTAIVPRPTHAVS